MFLKNVQIYKQKKLDIPNGTSPQSQLRGRKGGRHLSIAPLTAMNSTSQYQEVGIAGMGLIGLGWGYVDVAIQNCRGETPHITKFTFFPKQNLLHFFNNARILVFICVVTNVMDVGNEIILQLLILHPVSCKIRINH